MHPTDQELKETAEAVRHHQQMMNDARPSTMPQACRQMTARELLAERIEDMRRDLARLDALYRALPLELPHEADQALFNLLVRAR